MLREVSVWHDLAATAWLQTGFLNQCEFRANVNAEVRTELCCNTESRLKIWEHQTV